MEFTLHIRPGQHKPYAQTVKTKDLIRRKEFCKTQAFV